MSHHALKELFEKLKEHAQKQNDTELDHILEQYRVAFEAQTDDPPGGNSPDPAPDLP